MFNFSLIVAVFVIVPGYLAAVLFQSWYYYLDTGVFKWGVGATFYGGLIDAVVVFLSIYDCTPKVRHFWGAYHFKDFGLLVFYWV